MWLLFSSFWKLFSCLFVFYILNWRLSGLFVRWRIFLIKKKSYVTHYFTTSTTQGGKLAPDISHMLVRKTESGSSDTKKWFTVRAGRCADLMCLCATVLHVSYVCIFNSSYCMCPQEISFGTIKSIYLFIYLKSYISTSPPFSIYKQFTRNDILFKVHDN